MTAVTQTPSNHTILQGEGGEQGGALMLGEAQARHKEGGSDRGGGSERPRDVFWLFLVFLVVFGCFWLF